MTSIPDGFEVVESLEDARNLERPPLLVIDAVRGFLDTHGLGAGAFTWQRIGDGQSNLTYRLDRGDERMVLRRGPRPPFPKSAHNMIREARLQRALWKAGVKVPRILAICEDEAVLGVPFYVMEHLDGHVITDRVPETLSEAGERRTTAFAAIDTLVSLHSVDVTKEPLAGFGRPAGYLHRQVTLFSALWNQYTRRDIPDVAAVGDWLAANIPTSQMASVVHGDFRLGNVMFARTTPARVRAVLDWEMATLGDPLADLGYLVATYSEPDSTPTVMELSPVTRQSGYPTRGELVERYRQQLPLDLGSLPWYQTLALWKSAIFCEDMYTRWLIGERPGDEFAPTLEEGVPQLIAEAIKLSGDLPESASF